MAWRPHLIQDGLLLKIAACFVTDEAPF